MIVYVILVFLLILFYLFLITPEGNTRVMRDVFSQVFFAHRGLHTRDKSIPENSLAAFRAAAAAGFGIEFDIRLTRDNEIVVFHDDTLERICGVKGRVSEMESAELQKYRLSETGERIPFFAEVLTAIDGRVPLIIEIKSGKRNELLCQKAMRLLDGYNGSYCIESFDPRVLYWFQKKRPEVLRGQLTSSFNELKRGTGIINALVLSRVLSNCIARPHFIAHSKQKKTLSVRICEVLGASKYVWTVNDEDDYKKLEIENDGVIFEFFIPEDGRR